MTKNILYSALFVATVLSSCTGKFEEYNRDLYGATDEDLLRTAQNGNELKNLITWVVPNQENGYQMTFSIVGGPLSGFAAATGFIDDIASYTPRSGWVDYPYKDTYANHLYANFRPILNTTKGDLSMPNYAIGSILRIAITHYVSDIYGPVPYSKVTGISLDAVYDTQKELYTAMLADLKAAAEALDANPIVAEKYADYDDVYGGDLRKWTKYARSLMLRMSLRISKADPAMAQEYAEWAVSKGVITENADNAEIKSNDNPYTKIEQNWGDQRVGADIVGYLTAYNDPRLEKMIKPGSTGLFVGLIAGEKDIKKDGDTRNKYAYTNTTNTSPMMWISAAEVSFLKAEGKLLGWNMGTEDAKTLYENGIRLSFEQWGASGVEDYLKVTSLRKGYVDPIQPDHSNPDFKSDVTVAWDSANGDVEAEKAMIATQKWIALFPYNTIEAWAEWRRTGYPNLLPALVNKSGGAVEDIHRVNGRDRGGMRRLTFPQSEYENNKEGLQSGLQDLGGEDSYATDLWWAKQ